MKRVRNVVTMVLATVLLTAACGTGDDAVSQGDTFQFVSPGGKQVITYDQPDRKPMRAFSGEDLMGNGTVSLEQFNGKAVVINIWGSWCGPCRAESDDLEKTYAKFKDRGVAFIGINFRDNRDSARDFVTDRKITYPSIYDYGGRTIVRMTIPTSVVPTTVVLDPQHRPAVVHLKTVTEDELTKDLNSVLGQKN